MSDLAQYKSLTDWAINAHRDKDTPSDTSRKLAALAELNRNLGTAYKEQHLNNWLAGRMPTPRRVVDFWVDQILETEVEFEDYELGSQLRRLCKNH